MCVPPKSCQFIINKYYLTATVIMLKIVDFLLYIYHCHNIISHQVMNLNFLCDGYYLTCIVIIVNLTTKFTSPNFSRLGSLTLTLSLHPSFSPLSLKITLLLLVSYCWYIH